MPLLGANVDLDSLSPQDQVKELKRLAEAGAKCVRLPLDWNRVEPQPGQFDWKADDAIVNAALKEGLEVVLVLGPCAEWAVDPNWQVPADQKRFSIPKSIELWERYVFQAVKHYQGRVCYWQVREQPNVHNFRGARKEYFQLLAAAARVAKKVDPACSIIIPEAGSIDVAAVDSMAATDAWDSCDIVGLYLGGASGNLSSTTLPWAALTSQVMGEMNPAKCRPIWVLGGADTLSAEFWVQRYLLASAFGVERFFLPAQTLSREWTYDLSCLRYIGFIRLGPIWALAFEGAKGSVVAAWSEQETEVPAEAIAPVVDLEKLKQASPLGGLPGAVVRLEGEKVLLRLGPQPALLYGLEAAQSACLGLPTPVDVLAARPGPDLSPVPAVYADYGMMERPEFGLYNRPLRNFPGGKIGEEMRDTRLCLRTRMRPGKSETDLDDPWIYFDVDDKWLYLNRGKTKIAITVECEAAFVGEQKLGFNIMYDSTSGYRFTHWQWVDPVAPVYAGPGFGWHRYRFELDDVNFTNREGYDFRINAKGSKQDLWVAAVTVEKIE